MAGRMPLLPLLPSSSSSSSSCMMSCTTSVTTRVILTRVRLLTIRSLDASLLARVANQRALRIGAEGVMGGDEEGWLVASTA
jgi:hypothetical protein